MTAPASLREACVLFLSVMEGEDLPWDACKNNSLCMCVSLPPSSLLPPSYLLLISTAKSAGEQQRCMFSPELSLILSFPLGRRRKTHTATRLSEAQEEYIRVEL